MKKSVQYSFGHKVGKKIVKILDSTVNIAVLVLLLLLFLLGCYSLWDSHLVYQQADAAQYEIYKPSDVETTPSFADLVVMNPDTIAWLTVNETGVDYPLAYTDNNETYVNTDIFGNYSLTGALFLDYMNQPDFSDFNSIIYGHHMDMDKMFGDLDKFRDGAYFDTHEYGNLYYQGENHGLVFFAFLEADAYDSSIYQVAVSGEENRQIYLDNLYEKASFTRDIGVTPQDRIVLLSTCSSDTTNGRFILVGKITEDYYPEKTETVTETRPTITQIDSPESLLSWLEGAPWYVWVLLIFWIILLIILLCWLLGRARGRRRWMVLAYEAEDLEEMIQIWNEVVEEGIAFPQETSLDEESGKAFFESQTYCGVAKEVRTGEILGLYILHPNNVGRCGHIANASYAVKSKCRGHHIGESLVLDSLTKAREAGYGVMQFNAVVADNIHARNLYERLGFRELGRIPEGFHRKDGHYEDIFLYYQKLQEMEPTESEL